MHEKDQKSVASLHASHASVEIGGGGAWHRRNVTMETSMSSSGYSRQAASVNASSPIPSRQVGSVTHEGAQVASPTPVPPVVSLQIPSVTAIHSSAVAETPASVAKERRPAANCSTSFAAHCGVQLSPGELQNVTESVMQSRAALLAEQSSLHRSSLLPSSTRESIHEDGVTKPETSKPAQQAAQHTPVAATATAGSLAGAGTTGRTSEAILRELAEIRSQVDQLKAAVDAHPASTFGMPQMSGAAPPSLTSWALYPQVNPALLSMLGWGMAAPGLWPHPMGTHPSLLPVLVPSGVSTPLRSPDFHGSATAESTPPPRQAEHHASCSTPGQPQDTTPCQLGYVPIPSLQQIADQRAQQVSEVQVAALNSQLHECRRQLQCQQANTHLLVEELKASRSCRHSPRGPPPPPLPVQAHTSTQGPLLSQRYEAHSPWSAYNNLRSPSDISHLSPRFREAFPHEIPARGSGHAFADAGNRYATAVHMPAVQQHAPSMRPNSARSRGKWANSDVNGDTRRQSIGKVGTPRLAGGRLEQLSQEFKSIDERVAEIRHRCNGFKVE
mmetsp:Transcript_16865/g.39390  ORF Transcript_16865/g.39390 Transcript_16865/m.39390 type:complete len:557 (+) Transcript_16865:301-1971(+)